MRFDYQLFPNMLLRQVLLYLICRKRVQSTVIVWPVWRLWVLRGERPGLRQRERERETSSWALNALSWAVMCTVHYTVQADTAGHGGQGSERQRVGQTRDQGPPSELSPDSICCSSLPWPRWLWLSLWQNVTVWQVSHRAQGMQASSNGIRNLSPHNQKNSDRVKYEFNIISKTRDTGG